MLIEEAYDDVSMIVNLENQFNKRNDEKLFNNYTKFSELIFS